MKPAEQSVLHQKKEAASPELDPFVWKPALVSAKLDAPVENHHNGCCSGHDGHHQHGGAGCCGKHQHLAKAEKP